MLATRAALVVLAGVIAISAVQDSESTLWDLLISAEVTNAPLGEGQNPVLTGLVVDHAGKPVPGATVQMRASQSSIATVTGLNGTFGYTFEELKLLPGEHIINIRATLEDKRGLAGVTYQVSGDVAAYSYTEKILESDEARRYLASGMGEHEGDPIGMSLYRYYKDLQAQLLEERRLQERLDEMTVRLDEVRDTAEDLKDTAIDEEKPGAGVFGGIRHDRFLAQLDPDVKDLVGRQLNFTKDLFADAQQAMKDVLAAGGTYEEARAAYIEKATVSQELMEIVTYGNKTAIESEEIPEDVADVAPPVDLAPVTLNGTDIRVGASGNTVFLSINGTLVEFIVNGTQIIPVSNHAAAGQSNATESPINGTGR